MKIQDPVEFFEEIWQGMPEQLHRWVIINAALLFTLGMLVLALEPVG